MPATTTRLHSTRPDPQASPPPAPSLLVLGIDPGLHYTGYGAVSGEGGRPRVREAGVLTTSDRLAFGPRLRRLFTEVEGLLAELRPDVVVLEDLFVHTRFPRTAIVLGHARGIIYLAAASVGVRVLELAPSVVKRAVAGHGRASKAQVQAAVCALLGLGGVRDAHAADALALAYAGLARAQRARAGGPPATGPAAPAGRAAPR